MVLAKKSTKIRQHNFGKPLQIFTRTAHPDDYQQNLWVLLQQAASTYPAKGISFREAGLSSESTKIRYGELLQQAADRGTALLGLGFVDCTRLVIVFSERLKDIVVWTWSVIASGTTPEILPPLTNDPKTKKGQLDNLADLFGSPTVFTHRSLFEHFASVPSFRLQDAGDI